MDLASIIGILTGFGLFIAAIGLGGSLKTFWDPASLLIVLGGTTAATLVNYPMVHILGMFKVLSKAFVKKSASPKEFIELLVRFAEKARREGLLALEEESAEVGDPFLQKGIQLVVDGTDPELVRNVLETELAFLSDRHKGGQSIFQTMGSLAPAFGMIGTLIGLIEMLRNLDDPNAIGPGLATALMTTFYGAVLANLIFIPVAGKLGVKSQEEILLKEVMIEGILSIQAGDNPRIVGEKLKAFLAPKVRDNLRDHSEIRQELRGVGEIGSFD